MFITSAGIVVETKQKKGVAMTKITIYDTDCKRIESLCEKYDTTEAELISNIMDNLTNEEIDLMCP